MPSNCLKGVERDNQCNSFCLCSHNRADGTNSIFLLEDENKPAAFPSATQVNYKPWKKDAAWYFHKHMLIIG